MNQSIKDIFKLIEDEPNNMKLGKKVRQYYWDALENENTTDEETHIFESPDGGETIYKRKFGKDDRELVSEKSISIDRAKTRMKYLKTELAHERYWDGWSVKSMKEELQWLEKEVSKYEKS